MTRSARWNRPLAAFLALWVALVVGEPSLVHSCPVHDGMAAAGHGSHVAAMATVMEMPASSRSAHGADASTTTAPADTPAPSHQDGHHGCTCPGDCSAGSASAPALPAPPTGALVVATYRAVAGARPAAASRPRLAPPHALPFANGPPAAPSRAA